MNIKLCSFGSLHKSFRLFALVTFLVPCLASAAAELPLHFPLQRTVYQTDETIPVMVLRQAEPSLEAGSLDMVVTGQDGSSMTFTFAVAASENTQRAEHLNLDARLLRPGSYTLTLTADGLQAEAAIEIRSHLRKSSFRTVNWGSRANGAQHLRQGEDSLGYNLVMKDNGVSKIDPASQMLGGVDWTSCCAMGGAHQIDMSSENDWSDPNVLTHGATRRIMRDVFGNRTSGNAIGTHFYDEPGLTWGKDPETGAFVPHVVPSQMRAYEAAFGEKPIRYNEVDPNNPEDVRRWKQWATWKLGFMPAAWRDAAWAANYVRPDYIPFTQSQYGYSAFTDGYYFNVVESLPLVSGHGGYHGWGPGIWHPSWTLDIARARDRAKPCWYLPQWFNQTTETASRMEQYLSFATGIQGLMTPPPMDPAAYGPGHGGFEGLVEANKLMLRLGTIFTTMEERVEDVAILYSQSDMLHEQATENMDKYYSHDMKHGKDLFIPYIAGKLNQRTFQYIVDEDVVDGTLSMNHQVLILYQIDHLAPAVVRGLEDFIAEGGVVLKTRGGEFELEGIRTIPADVTPTKEALATAEAAQVKADAILERKKPLSAIHQAIAKQIQEIRNNKELSSAEQKEQFEPLLAERKANRDKMSALDAEAAPLLAVVDSIALTQLRGLLKVVKPFGEALEPMLIEAGIPADMESSEPGLTVQVQGVGDVQYDFLINTTHDPDSTGLFKAEQLALKAITAKVALPVQGAALYDAIRSTPVTELSRTGDRWSGELMFGQGQMRVYAQTARPIGSVQVLEPILHRDLTVYDMPIQLNLSASVLADDGVVLNGSIPLRVRVTDALGAERYEFFRATTQGTLRMTIPLAANDPAGEYKVTVEELLSGKTGTSTFEYDPATRLGSLAGTSRRALVYDRDWENIFRFFRIHQDVTIVVGDNPEYQATAERIADFLKPWVVRTTITDSADLMKGKEIKEDMRPALAGMSNQGRTWMKENERSDNIGLNIEGPVLFIGTPQDNPGIAFIEKNGFLPVVPSASTPGPERGLLAFQRGIVGARQDSITLIAYDQTGLDEAAGSLYEILAGIKPLTPWTLPETNKVHPATQAKVIPAPTLLWSAPVTDRALALGADGNIITVITRGPTREMITATGTVTQTDPLNTREELVAAVNEMKPAGISKELKQMVATPTHFLRNAVTRGDTTAAVYVGGLVRFFDVDGGLLAEQQFDYDITHCAWLNDTTLIVAFSDATVRAIQLP